MNQKTLSQLKADVEAAKEYAVYCYHYEDSFSWGHAEAEALRARSDYEAALARKELTP